MLWLIGSQAHGNKTDVASTCTMTHDILAAHHAATGDTPVNGTLSLVYQQTGMGIAGVRTEHLDLHTGAWLRDWQAGELRESFGFDGATPWMRDLSGACTRQQGGDRIPLAINEAYRRTNRWWQADHGGAHLDDGGEDTVGGRRTHHLRVHPRGGLPFDAWFDAQTHLLVRIAEDRQFFHTTTSLTDHRLVSGAMLPHTVEHDAGTGDAGLERLTLVEASLSEARDVSFFACPPSPAGGISIEDRTDSVSLPFRFLNNHAYVDVMVEGRGPFNFLVDTGGRTLVAPHLVRALSLQTLGTAAMSGAGEQTKDSGFVKLHELALGGVHMRDQIAIAVDIYSPSVEGVSVDGMLGFELFRRFAVTIDHGRRRIVFTRPAAFQALSGATAVPFTFYDHLPYVQGRVDDLLARFTIDSGSRSDIDITTPFVARHGLGQRFRRSIEAVTGWGMGGPSRSTVVRLPQLAVGDVTVPDTIANLSRASGGFFTDPHIDGNVGTGFLKRFVVQFDYQAQVMHLVPLDPPACDAGRFDRAGLWINAGDTGYDVMSVSPGGPADRAGLCPGDVITSIDSRPAVATTLSDARAVLRTLPAGQAVVFERRGAAPLVVVLEELI